MGVTTELLDLDAQIFRLQAEFGTSPDAEGTRKLEQLLKTREKLLLKIEREERERLSSQKYERP